MKSNKDWFSRTFRVLITAFVFGFYIAMVFFAFRQNWDFLFSFSYWVDTGTATTLALMFRWLYSDTGVNRELEFNEDIKDLEKGKSTEITKVSNNNTTDLLKVEIDLKNKENKLQSYKDKCDTRINYYREKAWYKFFRKSNLDKWKKRKLDISSDEFNLNAIKVSYYRYDIDEMLSTFYKQPNKERYGRITKNQFVVSSLRTNVITILAIMVYNALDVLRKEYTPEALFVMLGKLIIFSVNIYTGYGLGKDFIKNIYSSNLTDDYVFLKEFNKKK